MFSFARSPSGLRSAHAFMAKGATQGVLRGPAATVPFALTVRANGIIFSARLLSLVSKETFKP